MTLFKYRKAYCNSKVDINLIKCLDMDLHLHFRDYKAQSCFFGNIIKDKE